MKHRILAALLAVSMAASFVGCSAGSSDENSTSSSGTNASNSGDSDTEDTAQTTQNYTWLVEPTIEADDIIVLDESDVPNEEVSIYDMDTGNSCNQLSHSEYAIIENDGLFDFIDYSGNTYLDERYSCFYACVCGEVVIWNGVIGDGCTSLHIIDDFKIGNGSNGHGGSSQRVYYDSTDKAFFDTGYGDRISENESAEYLWIWVATDDNPCSGVAKEIEANVDDDGNVVDVTSLGDKFALVDENKLTSDFIFDLAYFDNYGESNVAACKKDDKWAYFNIDGAQLTDYLFDDVDNKFANDFSYKAYLPTEGLIAVRQGDGMGYYNTDGEEVIPCGEFEETRPVYNGKAWVKKDGKWGVIGDIGTVVTTADDIVYPWVYDSEDVFVKDCLWGIARYKDGSKVDGTKWVIYDTTIGWQELAENLIDTGKVGTAAFWKNASSVIDGDFLELVSWEQTMYETLIMDWLAYDFDSDEYKEEYNSDVSKFGYDLTKYISECADLSDESKVKDLDVEKASDFLDEDFWNNEIDMGDVGVVTEVMDSVISGVKTTTEMIDKMSNIMAVRKASQSRINFLNIVYKKTTDDNLKKAIEKVNKILNDSLSAVGDEFTYETAKLCVEYAWGEITGALKLTAESIGNAALSGAVQSLSLIKLGKAGLNLFFDTDAIAEYNLQLAILYIINSEFHNVYSSDAAYVSRDEQTAAAFNDKYLAYWSYQAYATNICKEYWTEKVMDKVAHNELSIFDDNNLDSYKDVQHWLAIDNKRMKTRYDKVSYFRKIYASLCYTGLLRTSDDVDQSSTVSESDLKSAVESAAGSSVSDWFYDDYDLDGKYEAFALISKTEYGSEAFKAFYFVDCEAKVSSISLSGHSYTSGFFGTKQILTEKDSDGYKFFTFSLDGGGSGSSGYLYGVKDGEYYELQASLGDYDWFAETDGKLVAYKSVFGWDGETLSPDGSGHFWIDCPMTFNEDTKEFTVDETKATPPTDDTSSSFPSSMTPSKLSSLGDCVLFASYNNNYVFVNATFTIAESLDEIRAISFDSDSSEVNFKEIKSYDDTGCETHWTAMSGCGFDDSTGEIDFDWYYGDGSYSAVREPLEIDSYSSKLGAVSLAPVYDYGTTFTDAFSIISVSSIDWSSIEFKKESEHTYITFETLS